MNTGKFRWFTMTPCFLAVACGTAGFTKPKTKRRHLAKHTMAGLVRRITLAVCALQMGCSSGVEFEPHRVSKQSDAGEVFVSTTFIAPWEDYVERLTKPFELSTGEALNRVLPITSGFEDQVATAIGANLQANFVGPITTGSQAVNVAADGTVTQTSESTTTEAAPSTDGLGTSGPPAASLEGKLQGNTELALGVDPFVQYNAAKALHDEVQLLSSFVGDAARRHDMVPYILRLQITNAPYARHQPYDTHLTLSFFSERICELNNVRGTADNGCDGEDSRSKLKREQAIVVPLLVTDAAERQASFRSRSTTRQLALALAASQGSVAAALGLDGRFERLNSILAEDVNSLLTVGSPTPGSLYVRLGAQTEATARYATVPRNHNVTMLVMVPKDAVSDNSVKSATAPPLQVLGGLELGQIKNLTIAGTVSLRDAESGALLTRDQSIQRAKDIAELIKQSTGTPKVDVADGSKLLFDVFFQDFNGFKKRLKSLGFNGLTHGNFLDLWNRAVEMVGRSGYVGDRVDLPKKAPAAMPPKQTLVLDDDGKAKLTANLYGGNGLTNLSMASQLRFSTKDHGVIALQAKKVTVSANGIAMEFESPIALGLTMDKFDSVELDLSLQEQDGYFGGAKPSPPNGILDGCGVSVSSREETWLGCYRSAILKKPAKDEKSKSPPKALSLKSWTDVITRKDNKGSTTITVDFLGKPKLAARSKFTVNQATIVSITGSDGSKLSIGADGSFLLSDDTTFTLQLDNLIANTEVEIKASALKADGKTSAGSSNTVTLRVM